MTTGLIAVNLMGCRHLLTRLQSSCSRLSAQTWWVLCYAPERQCRSCKSRMVVATSSTWMVLGQMACPHRNMQLMEPPKQVGTLFSISCQSHKISSFEHAFVVDAMRLLCMAMSQSRFCSHHPAGFMSRACHTECSTHFCGTKFDRPLASYALVLWCCSAFALASPHPMLWCKCHFSSSKQHISIYVCSNCISACSQALLI